MNIVKLLAKHTNSIILLILGCSMAVSSNAQDQELVSLGKKNYEQKCAPCHDRGAGSDASPMSISAPDVLTLKYKGDLSPYIAERSDLANFTVLEGVIRGGTISMMPYRKTEVSDHDIEAIAAYFGQNAAALNNK